MISESFLQNTGSLQQIDQTTILREYFQLVFLKYFYQKSRQVYFKGGTAIRFLFNSFRYSEDLDFTSLKKDNYLKEVTSIIPQIETETNTQIKISKQTNIEDIGQRIRLIFQPNQIIKQPLGIKLDFSFREKPLDKESTVIITNYPISPPPLVNHYSQKEILAEKIRAMFTRNKARDLFDLWFLLKNDTPIVWEYVDQKMKYYPKVSYSEKKLISSIKKYNPDKFKQDLNQFLPKNYRQMYPQIITETVQILNQAFEEK